MTQEFGVIPRSHLEQRVVMPNGQLGAFKLVRKDDFVISLRSFQGGIEHSDFVGLVSPAYTVLRTQKEANPRYLKYLLKSAGFISELNTAVTGVREGKNISFAELAYSLLPLPPQDEQDRIVSFLDQKVAEIDAAIAKKDQLIEKLFQSKRSIVYDAVTIGLSNRVQMSETGLPWLPVAPAHWALKRLKFISSFITSGPRGWSDRLTTDEGSIFLQSGNLNDSLGVDVEGANRVNVPKGAEAKRTLVQDGDILICITGANTGRVALVNAGRKEIYINQHLSLVRLVNINQKFVAYSLSSQGNSYFYLCQYGLKEGLSLFDVNNAPVLLPPIDEQKEIVEFLDCSVGRIEASIASIAKQRRLLDEAKRKIIADAVMGKLKI